MLGSRQEYTAPVSPSKAIIQNLRHQVAPQQWLSISDHPHHKHLPASHPGPQTSLLSSDDFKAYLLRDSECLRKLYLPCYPISLNTTGPTSYPLKSLPPSKRPKWLHSSAQLTKAHPVNRDTRTAWYACVWTAENFNLVGIFLPYVLIYTQYGPTPLVNG